jgi:pimeloyl-ACP methyl ester carboxylesterase
MGLLALFGAAAPRVAALQAAPSVTGAPVTLVSTGAGVVPPLLPEPTTVWSSLVSTTVAPGARWLSFPVAADSGAVLVPWCAGRVAVLLDGHDVHAAKGPVVLDVAANGHPHVLTIAFDISDYERRITCGEPPRVGARATTQDGLLPLDFASPHAALGGGHAVVYVPPGHDRHRRGPLLVGLHPWNGSPWTYSAYEPLLAAARAADVLLLFPSGLGNSLYTADAEDEVLRAIDALLAVVAVDPDRITLWGASMGGGGATTIGFHHPDRFAAIISLFGDSKYDLSTYVRGILGDGASAHRVNALDIVDNARNVPVWLVHGQDDRVSPIAQSAMLARALEAKHFEVRFDRVPNAGHEGRVVTDFADRIVSRAATARRVYLPSRVSYWSVVRRHDRAYGIRLKRAHTHTTGDAFFDLARVGESVHLVHAEGVTSLRLPRGAFGIAPTATPAVVADEPSGASVRVEWDPVE